MSTPPRTDAGSTPLDISLRALVEPVLSDLRFDLYDLDAGPQLVRILVDTDDGITSDELATATRVISRLFDDTDPVPGKYVLEVSSPGVERPLRTSDHFRGAIGESVTIKCGPAVEGDRRVRGTLLDADDDGVTVVADDPDETRRRLDYSDIAKARVVFEWDTTGSATRKASRT